MATFEGIQHIGQKVFSFLSAEDLMKCRLVCESWKIILENPKLWLQNLENIGQPKNISKKWLYFLEKAKESDIPKSRIVNLMILKYQKFMKLCRLKKMNKRLGSKFFHDNEIKINFPPIYQALHCKPEDLEVLKLVMEIDKRSFILPINIKNFWITPLMEAIIMNANLEVIKCLTSKLRNPFEEMNGTTILHIAIRKSNVEVCKFLVDQAPSPKVLCNTLLSPFKLAFSMENRMIIKCLALNSPMEDVRRTLLHALNDYKESRVPVENRKHHLLEKINFVGSLIPDLELSSTLHGCLKFPLTDSDFHEIHQPFTKIGKYEN